MIVELISQLGPAPWENQEVCQGMWQDFGFRLFASTFSQIVAMAMTLIYTLMLKMVIDETTTQLPAFWCYVLL